jgi:hypothetical protein
MKKEELQSNKAMHADRMLEQQKDREVARERLEIERKASSATELAAQAALLDQYNKMPPGPLKDLLEKKLMAALA